MLSGIYEEFDNMKCENTCSTCLSNICRQLGYFKRAIYFLIQNYLEWFAQSFLNAFGEYL